MIKPVTIDNKRYRGFKAVARGGKIHIAHDYDCPEGTEIHAVAKGKVIFSDLVSGFGSYNPSTPGGVLIVEHKTKSGIWFTGLYGHCYPFVKLNQNVDEGEIIGKVGTYFHDSYLLAHLHFAIHIGHGLPPRPWGYRWAVGSYVDPNIFIQDN